MLWLVVAVVLTAAALCVLVYRYDLYEREPWPLLVLAGILGALAMYLVGWVEDWLIQSIPLTTTTALSALAAVAEESAKSLVVLAICLLFRRHFNDPMDGIVYGSMVGLGAGLAESALYISLSSASVAVFGQECIRLVLHLLLGGLDGFALGLARAGTRLWPLALLVWISGSMSLHFFWDLWCGLSRNDLQPNMQRWIAVGLMLAGLAAFGGSLVLASRLSRMQFAPRSLVRLWRRNPAGAAPSLSSAKGPSEKGSS